MPSAILFRRQKGRTPQVSPSFRNLSPTKGLAMKNLNRFLMLLIVCLACLVPFQSAFAGALYGSVVEVVDGSTITVKVDKRLIKVRLCTVLTPRKDQELAEIAKFHLASLLTGKQV